MDNLHIQLAKGTVILFKKYYVYVRYLKKNSLASNNLNDLFDVLLYLMISF